jgi:hypothetical protein
VRGGVRAIVVARHDHERRSETAMRNATSAALALAAVATLAAAPAAARADHLPIPDRGPCHMHVKSSYRADAVLAHGLRLKITCSEPARFFVGADFEGRAVGDWITKRFGDSGDPGAEASTRRALQAPAGTHTYTLHFASYARDMSRAIPRIRMGFGIGVDRGDGLLNVGPEDWEHGVLLG